MTKENSLECWVTRSGSPCLSSMMPAWDCHLPIWSQMVLDCCCIFGSVGRPLREIHIPSGPGSLQFIGRALSLDCEIQECSTDSALSILANCSPRTRIWVFNAIPRGTCNPHDHPGGHSPEATEPWALDLKRHMYWWHKTGVCVSPRGAGAATAFSDLGLIYFRQGPLKLLPLWALNLPATDLVLHQDPKATVLWDNQQ